MVRLKNRWLLVEFIPDQQQQHSHPIDSKLIYTALKDSILLNFGDTGWGALAISLNVKYYSPTTNISIIRVGRDHHKTAWAALTLITSIQGRRYIPNVIHLSGTIKHAQLAAISHNREIVARYRALANRPATYQDSYDTYLESSTMEIQALQD